MTTSAPGAHSIFPLTVFDRVFERTTFVTGWLVEGEIDTAALAAALDRVTEKWRMLSGRLESSGGQDKTSVCWRIRIPLGPLPAGYRRYALTSSISEVPLSQYLSIPVPLVSSSLPYDLLVHPSTPRQYTAWESTGHPLTCWHVTHFPAEVNEGLSYSCIGFARSHGIFDGVGASFIMQALVAEMMGTEWTVPALPNEGLTVNPIQEAIDLEANASHHSNSELEGSGDYSILGAGGVLKLVGSQLFEKWWRGADRKVLLMPKHVLTFLVDSVRKDIQREHNDSVKVTTGDILVAWLVKTVYASGTAPTQMVHCSNFASFRSLFSNGDPSHLQYTHNAFVSLPYPVLSVADINAITLPAMAHLLAVSRESLSTAHVISAYKILQQSPMAIPAHPKANETLVVSNVSASRILESDWSAVGGTKTLVGYRYQLTPTKVMLANAVYIAGRLGDGSVVLDSTLNQARLDLLVAEIERLIGAQSAVDLEGRMRGL